MRAGEASGDSEVGATLPQSAVETTQAMQQSAGLFPVDRVNMDPESARMRQEAARSNPSSGFGCWCCGLRTVFKL